jgi:prophage regulatory protein
MARREITPIKRTIRRDQLREMVPLADSTIYEMEQRGEFPRRFALSARCVVWDLAEVEAWLAARRSTPLARAPHPDVRRQRAPENLRHVQWYLAAYAPAEMAGADC